MGRGSMLPRGRRTAAARCDPALSMAPGSRKVSIGGEGRLWLEMLVLKLGDEGSQSFCSAERREASDILYICECLIYGWKKFSP